MNHPEFKLGTSLKRGAKRSFYIGFVHQLTATHVEKETADTEFELLDVRKTVLECFGTSHFFRKI